MTTGAVIGTGPKWNRTLAIRGEAIMAASPSSRTAIGRASTSPASAREQGPAPAARRTPGPRRRAPGAARAGRCGRQTRAVRVTGRAFSRSEAKLAPPRTRPATAKAASCRRKISGQQVVAPAASPRRAARRRAAGRDPEEQQAPVQKMPVPSRPVEPAAEEHAARVGVTTSQPSAPIMARFRAERAFAMRPAKRPRAPPGWRPSGSAPCPRPLSMPAPVRRVRRARQVPTLGRRPGAAG